MLIDPPYEVSRKTNFNAGEKTGRDTDRFRLSMDFGTWDRNAFPINMVIKECYRVLKNGGTIICFYDLWKVSVLRKSFEENNFRQIRFVEWIKTNPVPINSKLNYLTNAREIALTAVKGSKPIFHSEYDNGIYRYPVCHEKGRFHPTQKPLELIISLILKHSDENALVLDCFSGSGCSNGLATLFGSGDYLSTPLSISKSALSGLSLGELMTVWFISLIVHLGVLILIVAIVITLASRIIEVFMYLSIAPIPMVTMMDSGEWAGIGKNWIKQLLALSFQGFFIIVALGIFKTLFSNAIIALNSSTDGVVMQMGMLLGYTAALIFTILRTGAISKSVFSAH